MSSRGRSGRGRPVGSGAMAGFGTLLPFQAVGSGATSAFRTLLSIQGARVASNVQQRDVQVEAGRVGRLECPRPGRSGRPGPLVRQGLVRLTACFLAAFSGRRGVSGGVSGRLGSALRSRKEARNDSRILPKSPSDFAEDPPSVSRVGQGQLEEERVVDGRDEGRRNAGFKPVSALVPSSRKGLGPPGDGSRACAFRLGVLA